MEHLNALFITSFKDAGLQSLEWNTIDESIKRWIRLFG